MIEYNYYSSKISRKVSCNDEDYNEYDNNGNLNSSTLSHSIKVFSHKSNSIDSKSKINMNNPGITSLKNAISKHIFPPKQNIIILLKSKNTSIKSKLLSKNKKLFLYNKNNNFYRHNSQDSLQKPNIFYKNKYKLLSPRKNRGSFIINITKFNKEKLKNEINYANRRILELKNKLKNLYRIDIYYKIFSEKLKMKEKLFLLNKNNNLENEDYRKQIYIYKLKLSKIRDNYITINKLNDDIKKEELNFKIKQAAIINKILELKLSNIEGGKSKINDNDSVSGSENDITDMSIDERLNQKNKNVFKINRFYPVFHKYK